MRWNYIRTGKVLIIKWEETRNWEEMELVEATGTTMKGTEEEL